MILFIKRILLKIVFGKKYDYMARTLVHDHRIKSARLVDFVVRKDGVERRIEADWLKYLAKIVSTPDLEEKAKKYNKETNGMFPKQFSRPILCENCECIKTFLE